MVRLENKIRELEAEEKAHNAQKIVNKILLEEIERLKRQIEELQQTIENQKSQLIDLQMDKEDKEK